MSENMITIGLMGQVIGAPIDEEGREKLMEAGYGCNYEGTLAYMVVKNWTYENSVGLNIFPKHPMSGYDFAMQIQKDTDVKVTAHTVRKFIDIWYNGADASHDDITLEEFLEKDKDRD